MTATENKEPTHDEASQRLIELLVKRCPHYAVEIFEAAAELTKATLRESHESVLKTLEKQP
jgi:hypothetical protein